MQEGRREPRYVGMPGWLVAEPRGDLTKVPWLVGELVEIGPNKWETSADKMHEHRTPVVVKAQRLQSHGHGVYSGRLVVQDGEHQYSISEAAFSPTPYWQCPAGLSENPPGPLLVETKSESKGVLMNGSWSAAAGGEKFGCGTASPSSPPEARGLVPCKRVGKKGEVIFLDAGDLDVVH